ncbi:hypothetical protein AAG570_003885 [Ranatra chinensis]|uniref:MADF domain-containing protein n=1 Tax=Ranatra chinensis TaxID=642074 RepID=A0ABD0Y3J9_9HEMI
MSSLALFVGPNRLIAIFSDAVWPVVHVTPVTWLPRIREDRPRRVAAAAAATEGAGGAEGTTCERERVREWESRGGVAAASATSRGGSLGSGGLPACWGEREGAIGGGPGSERDGDRGRRESGRRKRVPAPGERPTLPRELPRDAPGGEREPRGKSEGDEGEGGDATSRAATRNAGGRRRPGPAAPGPVPRRPATDSPPLLLPGSSAMDIDLLIAEVQARPPIYDFRHPDYTNKDVRDRYWEEIADAVGFTVYNFWGLIEETLPTSCGRQHASRLYSGPSRIHWNTKRAPFTYYSTVGTTLPYELLYGAVHTR